MSFKALVPSLNLITEHSTHDLYAHEPIWKNWGVKGVNSRVDLNCKWMGHFQKHEAGGTWMPANPEQKRGHQGSLFNYELSSRGRKHKTIQFRAD